MDDKFVNRFWPSVINASEERREQILKAVTVNLASSVPMKCDRLYWAVVDKERRN